MVPDIAIISMSIEIIGLTVNRVLAVYVTGIRIFRGREFATRRLLCLLISDEFI